MARLQIAWASTAAEGRFSTAVCVFEREDPLRRESDESEAKAAAIRQIQAGLYDQYFKIAFNTAAPFYWYKREDGSEGYLPKINGGTAFFVDTGEALFGVTAKHVLEAALKAAADSAFVCQLGSTPFDPSSRSIAVSSDSDLATFSVRLDEMRATGRIAHQPGGTWPPPPPEEGKGIFFGGFRGVDRKRESERIVFGFAAGVGVATNVAPDHFTIQFHRDSWVCQERWSPPTRGESWGGASGGPVYTIQRTRNGDGPELHSWRLAGLIEEAHDEWEIIRVQSLRNVHRDGTVIS